MKTILFVDDERMVLEGLRRMLFPHSDLWECEFVESGAEALAKLAESPFDVIITDMRMPGMNGAELLAEVAWRHPQMVRMILSGTWEMDLRMQAAMVAHQYLSKPCQPEVLKATLDRAFALRDVLVDPALRELIARTTTLPSPPGVYTKLLQALRHPETTAHQLGAIIAQDVAMTAKVLQLANSAYMGARVHIGDPAEAVVYLGIDSITALALSIGAFSLFHPATHTRFSIDALQRHSLAVAVLGRQIVRTQKVTKMTLDDTFTAGLLHDVGKLILVCNHGPEYERVLEMMAAGTRTTSQAEREVFGTTHAEVGGYLLWLWGLPDVVVEAVAFHHTPSQCPAAHFGPLTAVHVANCMEEAAESETPAENAPLDAAFLERVEVSSQLPAWWALHQPSHTECVRDG